MRGYLSWANLPLHGKGLVVVLIPVAALLTGTVSSYVNHRQGAQAAAWVTHTFQVRGDLQRLLTLAVDAETGTRGYLLTGRETFLEPYRKARRELPETTQRLTERVADDPIQRERLRRVEAAIRERLASLADLQRRVPAAPEDELLPEQLLENRVPARSAGDAVMDRLRRELDAMQVAEERLLAQRMARTRGLNARAVAAIVISTLLGLAGGLLAAFLFTSGVVRRIHRLEESARCLAQGVPLPPPLPGDDEIGRLGSALQESATLLAQRESERRRAEEAILASEQRLRVALQATSVIVMHVDRDLRYTWAYNLPHDDSGATVVGKLAEEVMPADEAAIVDEFRRKILETGVGARREHRARKPHGILVYDLTGEPVRDSNGAVVGVITAAVDITERKKFEERIAQLNQHLIRRAF